MLKKPAASFQKTWYRANLLDSPRRLAFLISGFLVSLLILVLVVEGWRDYRDMIAQKQSGLSASALAGWFDQTAAMSLVAIFVLIVVATLMVALFKAFRRQEAALAELSRTEAALADSHRDLAQAQRIGDMGSWVWNIVNNDLAWSDQIYRIFGLTPQEFDASYPAFLERVHPDDRDMVEDAVLRAVDGNQPYQIDHRIIRPDGAIRIVHEQGEVETDEAGRPVRMIGTVQDVTRSREIEAEYKEGRSFLRKVLDSMFAFVGMYDLDGTLIEANRAPLNAAGLSRADVIGKPFWEAYWWSYSAEAQSKIRQALARAAAGETVRDDFVVRIADQDFITIDATFGPIYDVAGNVSCVIGSGVDVTARKIAEETLRKNEATLSGILNISPEAVIVTDSETRITVFSAGAEEIFGYQADEVIGRKIDLLIPERFHQAHDRLVAEFAAGPAASRRMGERGAIKARRRNGEEFPAEASLSRLDTDDGTVFTTILRDITAELAANEELLEAKLRAETASEAKSRFMANMSHELRTPLNAIIGFSQIMKLEQFGSLGNPHYKEFADDIYESGSHLLELINDILDIARIEIGKIDIKDEVLDTREILESCVRMVAPRAAQADIELRSEIPAESPSLLGDSRLLKQIILNLLSNALKFTPAKGIVTLATTHGNDGIGISVRDTGIGMASEDVSRVGQPFFQGDSSFTRKHGGAGLGLAISRELAELHGGTLSFESALDRGTTVTLWLPPSRILSEPGQRKSHGT